MNRVIVPLAAIVLIIALAVGMQSCAVTKKPKGCGCGMEQRMGGRS